jgi:hypothetical protein
VDRSPYGQLLSAGLPPSGFELQLNCWTGSPPTCQRSEVLLTCLSLLAAATAGLAAPVGETGLRPVQIEIEAPEGCSGADAFFNSLRSRTDRVRRADGNEPHTTLQVRLTRTHGQVVGELRMVDDRGGTDSRKVQGASCEDVVQALSLTAALALDPSALGSAPATAPAGAAATPAGTSAGASAASGEASSTGTAPVAPAADVRARDSAKSSKDVAEPHASPSPVARRPVPTAEFAAGPVGLTVLSGSFSTGIAVAARKTLGEDGVFRPSLGLAIAYARNDVVQSPGAAQASLAALTATVCPLRLTASILTLQPCALLLGGRLSATSRTANHKSTVDRLWLSAGGSLRMAAHLGGDIALELEAGVTAPLSKRKFYETEPENVVAQTPTISPIVGLALTYGRH